MLFCWQGGLCILVLPLRISLSASLLNELMIMGGVLIFVSGLGVWEIKRTNTLNFLPALLVSPVVLKILHFL